MEQENDLSVAEDTEETEVEETTETEETETTDWKAEAIKAQAIAKRLKTKLEKVKSTSQEKVATPEPAKEGKTGDLDNSTKALLVAYGLKGTDELALAKTWMARTGDDADVLISDEIFQAKLGQLREAKATKEAMPTGSKRPAQQSRTDVEYWLGKDFSEVPADMRNKVIDEKLRRANNAE